MDVRGQKRLLAILLLVLLGSSAYRLLQMTGEGPAAGSRPALDRAETQRLAELEVPRLNLQDLRREKATYKPGRNPFRFAPAPERPKPAAEPPKARRHPAPRPARERPAAPVVAPRRRPPKVDFDYLGSFGPEARRIAVFVKDDEIYNAFVGDILLERFIVDKIGFESADIKFVGFPEAPETRLEAGG